MSREEVMQIIEDTGVPYKYSGIPGDELTFKLEHLKAMFEYLESVTEATCEFNHSEIGLDIPDFMKGGID